MGALSGVSRRECSVERAGYTWNSNELTETVCSPERACVVVKGWRLVSIREPSGALALRAVGYTVAAAGD